MVSVQVLYIFWKMHNCYYNFLRLLCKGRFKIKLENAELRQKWQNSISFGENKKYLLQNYEKCLNSYIYIHGELYSLLAISFHNKGLLYLLCANGFKLYIPEMQILTCIEIKPIIKLWWLYRSWFVHALNI